MFPQEPIERDSAAWRSEDECFRCSLLHEAGEMIIILYTFISLHQSTVSSITIHYLSQID